MIIHPLWTETGRTTRLITTSILGANGFDFFDILVLKIITIKMSQNILKMLVFLAILHEIQNEINFTNWFEILLKEFLEELKEFKNFTKFY